MRRIEKARHQVDRGRLYVRRPTERYMATRLQVERGVEEMRAALARAYR